MALSDVIPVGAAPSFIAASPSGAHLYVTNQGSNTVSVIDASTHCCAKSDYIRLFAFRLAVTPDGARVYVTNLNSDTVSVIDTATNAVISTNRGRQHAGGCSGNSKRRPRLCDEWSGRRVCARHD